MSDLEENLEEVFEDEPQSEPEPVGEYIGERNALNERHGKGWAILPNGDQYDGSYRNGIRHGHGLYVFKNGARYLGNYRCGVRYGFGKFIYPDGTFYEGQWCRNIKHGQGTYTYANGDTYSGAWYKGKRHGVGIYKWKDLGVYFEGTWRDGVRVGPCIVQYPNFMFHGYWDYKYPQGPGVFSFDDKHILHGYYRSESAFDSKEGKKACEKKLPNKFQEDQEEGEEDEEKVISDEEGEISQLEFDLKPSEWISQDMAAFDYSLLPQHPVPLPIEDSDIFVCDLDSEKTPSLDMVAKSLEPSLAAEIEEEAYCELVLEEAESQSEIECDFDNALKIVQNID